MLILLLFGALLGVGIYLYATQNTGTTAITLFQYHWDGVPMWVPIAATAAVVLVLLWLVSMTQSAIHGARLGAHRRRLAGHEATIAKLQADNARLREETANRPADMVERERVRDDEAVAAGELPTQAEGRVAERVRVQVGYRPTLGERVRAFFGGRGRAAY
jgi:hypothetical protein